MALIDAEALVGELTEAVRAARQLIISVEVRIEADALAKLAEDDGDPRADLQPGQRCPDCGKVVDR